MALRMGYAPEGWDEVLFIAFHGRLQDEYFSIRVGKIQKFSLLEEPVRQ